MSDQDHAAVLRQWEKDWRKAGYHPDRYEPLEAGAEALERSCGCIVCTCEDETQCQGCGAKECEYHGKIRKERDELHAENERLRSELKEARAMIPAQIIEIDEDGVVHETQDVPVMSEQDHATVLERMAVHESLPTTEQSACKAGAEALAEGGRMSDQQSVLAGADAVWDELRTENERLREQIYVGHEFVEDEDTGPKKLDGCRYTWPDGQSCGLSREKHALAVSRELAAARKRIAELEGVYQKCAAGHQYLADSHEYPCPWCEQGKNEQRINDLVEECYKWRASVKTATKRLEQLEAE